MELIGILICHSFSSREQLSNYTACEGRECNPSPHYGSDLSPFPFNVSENKDISDIFCFDHNLKAPEQPLQLCVVALGAQINYFYVKPKRWVNCPKHRPELTKANCSEKFLIAGPWGR